MPRSMNHFKAASDGQYFPSDQRLVYVNRRHSLLGIVEHLAEQSSQTRRRNHRPKGTSTLGHGDIERVHVGPRTGFPHDRSGAADMIRVAVIENQALKPFWRTAKTVDRPEDGCLLSRETGVDQRQPVVPALSKNWILLKGWEVRLFQA